MRAFESFVLSYLLNALWQVPVVFCAASIAARALRRAGAEPGFKVWDLAEVFSVVLPLFTLLFQPVVSPSGMRFGLLSIRRLVLVLVHHGAGAAPAGAVTAVTGPAVAFHPLHLPATTAGFVLGLYLASLLFFSARLLQRLMATRQLRRTAVPVELDNQSAALWQRARVWAGVPRTELLATPRVFGPAALGLFRPVVVLPRALLDSGAPEDLATVFAHECVHLHRNDFRDNLLSEIMTLPIAFHPALWLTRQRLAESREILCDQLAAPAVGGAEPYARSLVRLASLLVADRPAAAVHAIGIFDANDFERRIAMLTHPPTPLRGFRRVATITAVAALGFATYASALALRTGVTAQESAQQDTPSPPGTIRVSAGVMSGQVKYKMNPSYPQAAKEANIQGSVILHAVIGSDGTIQSLRIISGPEELRASAWEAVKQWVYKPYLLNGQPTAVETTITVNYTLAPDKPGANPSR